MKKDTPGKDCLAIVLAAGEGTRMRSRRPKVLHEIAGRSMLAHVLSAVEGAQARVALVVGAGGDEVARHAPDAKAFVQQERRGTAHAVLAAEPVIAQGCDVLIVAFADTPLMRPETFTRLRDTLVETGAAVAVLGFQAANPKGYGRLVMDKDVLVAIREENDASPQERALTLCNGGVMALDGKVALDLLKAVGSANAKNEFYLTDVVALARDRGLKTAVVSVDEDEIQGVNDRVQLAGAEASSQRRLREIAMRNGVTMIDPETVTLSFDTELGIDVVIEPNVIFGPNVKVHDGARIRAFSHLEGVTVGPRSMIGPFARLRPGSVLGEDVHIGNFVEVKASDLAAGVKANHLSYIGDSSVGTKTNVGAGTITCNYNGFQKFRTEIGANVFVGSQSALVAPLKIGDGAYIGTGAVVTEDVEADSLVIARARQVSKPGWAKQFRTTQQAVKTPTGGRKA